MTLDLSSLNPNQLAAVEWQDGPLLVMAGPGSGKTRVLTFRIARILGSTPTERFKVLAVTFTNKAAGEMRSRIQELLPTGRDRTLVTTFHSFAAEVLRQHGHAVGLKPDFTIISDDGERAAILKSVLRGLDETLSEELPEDTEMLPLLNKMIAECVDSSELKLKASNPSRIALLTAIFDGYQKSLIDSNCLDFGTLVSLAVKLLESSAPICRQIQRIYRYVCVDEFQDTNSLQFRFLRRLVPSEAPNLFIVADDDQVIYQWNGADPQRLAEVKSLYSMKTIQLPENYRCPPEIVHMANKLIQNNLDRAHDKLELVAHKPIGLTTNVELHSFRTFEDEKTWIAEELAKCSEADRNVVAVLSRTKKLLDALVQKCAESGLNAYVAVKRNEFISAPLIWIHSALRLVNASQGRDFLRRLCKAFHALEGKLIVPEDVVAGAVFQGGDSFRSFLEIATTLTGISEPTRQYLEKVRNTLLERKNFWAFISDALAWCDSVQSSGQDTDATFTDYEVEKSVWLNLQNDIVEQYGREEVTLHLLLQEMDLRSKEPPPPPNAVRCFTIHSAKGLEFRRVYLLGMVEDQLPSWAAVKKGSDSSEMREERRNCFVAITRTEELLSISYSEEYFGYKKVPSRFLDEMGLSK